MPAEKMSERVGALAIRASVTEFRMRQTLRPAPLHTQRVDWPERDPRQILGTFFRGVAQLCSIQVNRTAVGIPTAAGKWPRIALCLTDEAELSQCRDTIV
jgi:hypothetical protein